MGPGGGDRSDCRSYVLSGKGEAAGRGEDGGRFVGRDSAQPYRTPNAEITRNAPFSKESMDVAPSLEVMIGGLGAEEKMLTFHGLIPLQQNLCIFSLLNMYMQLEARKFSNYNIRESVARDSQPSVAKGRYLVKFNLFYQLGFSGFRVLKL